MKIFPRMAGLVLVLAASLFLGWADSWEALRQGAGEVSAVSARFTQEKHLKILARPLVSKGVFYFQAPDSLRWEYAAPLRSILVMHKGQVRRVIEKDGRFHEDAGMNLQGMGVVLGEITRWLNGKFDANPDFSAELTPGRKIILRPKNDALAAMIQKIELDLSERPGLLRAAMIFESADSYTRLVFEDAVLNAPIEASRFQEIP